MPKKQIPIKNIFYMLCYAWDILNISETINVKLDKCSDAENLLALVFSDGINKLIKYGLHGTYVYNKDELKTIRGKINIQETINSGSLLRNSVVCEYDEHTNNNVLNGIIKYTVDSLIRNNKIEKDIKSELKKQRAFFVSIDAVPPTKQNILKITFNRNNINYKLLINIAYMIYENSIPTEEKGRKTFKDFFRDKYMERVFEEFILKFYSHHLKEEHYSVVRPKINWPHAEDDEIWDGLFVIDDRWPQRRTDIVIENKKLNIQIIIDAKYYSDIYVDAFRSTEERNRVRTSHLNQVRGYLLDSKFKGKKYGALVYPKVDVDVNEGKIINIKDTPIVYKTINLYAENWCDIENDLLNFEKKFEIASERDN